MKKFLFIAFLLLGSVKAFCQLEIRGEQVVGSGTTKTYALFYNGLLYTATTVTWSVSGGTASISGSSTANPVSISTGGAGSFTITASVAGSGSCTLLPITFPVTVFTGGINSVYITGPAEACTNTGGNDYTVSPFITGDNVTYIWSISPSSTASIGNNGQGNIWINYSAPGNYSLTCTIVTGGGTLYTLGEYSINVVAANLDGSCSVGNGGGEESLMAFPNPVSETINIAPVDATKAGSVELKYTYKLYDKYGKALRSGAGSNKSKVGINVSALPSDTYYLTLTIGKKIVQKQIIVRH